MFFFAETDLRCELHLLDDIVMCLSMLMAVSISNVAASLSLCFCISLSPNYIPSLDAERVTAIPSAAWARNGCA